MTEEKSVNIKVEAISMGYYLGKIIKQGAVFNFEGKLNKGKLPLWVKACDPKDDPKNKKVKEEVVEEVKEVKEVKSNKKSPFSDLV